MATHYSILAWRILMDRGPWWATVHGVSKSQTRLSKLSTAQCPVQFVDIVELLSGVQLFVTPRTAACQASLSFTVSWSLLKLMSIESVMPSNYLILYYPLLLLPSIFPSIRVFSNESALYIKWPKYWNSVSASVLPVNIRD